MNIGNARPAPPFLLGFDVLSPLTDDMLRDAVARGLGFCGRYVNNLTPDERDRIFGFGLPILLYTEALTKVQLSEASGRNYGHSMAVSASLLSVPNSVDVVIDLDLPAAGSDVAAHVDAMAIALDAPTLAAGVGSYGAALYVGAPQPLTSAELFALRPNRYVKGGGRIVDARGELAEPACGWAALQLEPLEGVELAGVKVDVEVTKLDYEGRALVLWWPS